METYDNKILKNIFSLNRNIKKFIAISTDTVLCVFTVWFAFYLRLEEFILLKDIHLITILISIILVPNLSSTNAFFTFHSEGTSQSNIFSPDLIFLICSSDTIDFKTFKVSTVPCPVMLRLTGNSFCPIL